MPGWPLHITLLLLALTGCSPDLSRDDSPTIVREPLKWSVASDGSQVGSSSFDGYRLKSADAFRCWKKRGKFDCIAVHEEDLEGVPGPQRVVSRLIVDALPKDDTKAEPGYACDQTWSFMTEAISSSKGKLVSNQIGGLADREPWTSSFVNKYLRENGLGASPPYFKCLWILQLIDDGSFATLATTSVSYDLHMR